MIAFPSLLVQPAEQAGIPVPEDIENYDPDEYPYWNVFTIMQCGRRMPSPNAHWENAKIIAAIPADRIKVVTPHDIETEFGFA